ncbi:hypothetical protein BWQ96_10138 [Gracilariopsis chorda]|uniref:Uncharacterized protein n=1 Tax=Gracilariopsis chorda TaxID=448386 RepID=A0A2V3IG74_9FLOR|nr:hypothetical protein BWQ96_10138 [Gracilariopsis chorda]|eukprot:PXF40170.1 hypothetical protein BWQ96_10138 [Gracilariopsis chorda]
MTSTLTSVCLLWALLLVSHASASRLHRVSSVTGSPTVLRGRTLISGSLDGLKANAFSANAFGATPNAASLVASNPRLLEFSVSLKKNSVVYDELEEDGVQITSCTRDAGSRQATIKLSGDNLDSSDFASGTAFVIDVDDWEKHCGQVQPVEGVDEADDVLFYIIDAVSVNGKQVSLSMSIVPGSEVAPEVDIDVKEEPVFVTALPKKFIFNDSPLFATTSSLLSTSRNLVLNDSLPIVTRPTISHKAKINLFTGAVLEVDASLSANVNKFKVKRLFKTEVQWEQSLKARLDAQLTVNAKFKGERSGEIFRRPIPKFGFSVKIPFVGRIRAGAFGKVEWVADVEIGAALEASIRASHETKQRVTARIIPPRLNSKNLLPANAGSSGSSTFKFKDELNAEASIIGFVGVRPAVGVELTLGKKGIEGNIGAKLGLEADTRIKNPPFEAYTGSGLKIGKCNRCHRLRGGLNIKGKDLGVQLVKNGRVDKEKILIGQLFVIRLGTLCALPATCPANPPNPRSTPPPSKCRTCSSLVKCPSGMSCISGKCIGFSAPGQACGACSRCSIGSRCSRGRCTGRIPIPLPIDPIPIRPRPINPRLPVHAL